MTAPQTTKGSLLRTPTPCRYKTRCGTMYGHSGNTYGFTQYAAASSDGSRSMTISINLQRTHHNEGQAGTVFTGFR